MGVFEIERLHLPDCPYCRAEVNYIDSFVAKNHNSHRCANCGRTSSVKVNTTIFRIFIVIQIITIIAFVFSVIMGGKYCLLGLGVITLSSLVFYCFAPFTVRLLKPKFNNGESENHISDVPDNKAGVDTDSEIYSN